MVGIRATDHLHRRNSKNVINQKKKLEKEKKKKKKTKL